MTVVSEKIRFEVDISRVIEVLAKQIYQSPLALLRENTQNAFDAILLRKHLGHEFAPRIEITLNPNEVQIRDNGIGMSKADLRNHFWHAGSSSKNTPEAQAAGVVGTFGIGAMANFGVASELIVVTESALSGERTRSRALRGTLSATEECIELVPEKPTGNPGTVVTAKVMPGREINVGQARQYIVITSLFPSPIRTCEMGRLVVSYDPRCPLMRRDPHGPCSLPAPVAGWHRTLPASH